MHSPVTTPTLCRACLAHWPDGIAGAGVTACPACGLSTLRSHPELFALDIAHIDCDAFYASIEKRDDPSLKNKPVIVGHPGGRGVVTTACYIARRFGPRSAMPMFKALELCPDAVVIKPDMAKYKTVSRDIRRLMEELTETIEPVSLDEAYLDLSSICAKDKATPPAVLLAGLAKAVRREIGISISVGLAPNKFLAKLASDMDKPRGFAVIGHAEAEALLAPMPVKRIHGIGPASAARLAAEGITEIRQLQAMSDDALRHRFGRFGDRLAAFVRGRDPRRVTPDRETKSVSGETTFRRDLVRGEDLAAALGPLAMRVAERLARAGLAGQTVVLKLKTGDFVSLTRNHRLGAPTQRGDLILATALRLLDREVDGRPFRLIGVGVADIAPADAADPPDLFSLPTREFPDA